MLMLISFQKWSCSQLCRISIHLMLMLIVAVTASPSNLGYISIHLMLMLIRFTETPVANYIHFNTSHVNVNRNAEI